MNEQSIEDPLKQIVVDPEPYHEVPIYSEVARDNKNAE